MNRSDTAPHFIGLGGESSGSGFVYTYLAAHPQVCLIDQDTRFFCLTERFARGTQWYEHHYKDCKSGKVRGEGAHSYLACEETAERIVRTYPDAKLIAVVCNPIDRAYREYERAQAAGKIAKQMTFARYLEVEPEVLTRGLFGQQLQRFYDFYSPLQLLVLVHEDRLEQPVKYIRAAYKFLKTDETFTPKPLRQFIPPEELEDEKKPRWYFFVRLFTLPFRLLRLDRLLFMLWRLVRPTAKRLYHRYGPKPKPARVAPPPLRSKIQPELLRILEEYYAADVQLLSDLLRRNLSVEWDIAPPVRQ